MNIKLVEQLLLITFSISTVLEKNYLVKICPIFDDSALSCLTRYQEILSGFSLVCKNPWESACHTTDFHNRHHISVEDQILDLDPPINKKNACDQFGVGILTKRKAWVRS